MSGKLISASGVVVFRGPRDDREVLVVHRPAYDDWSLPKGKVSSNEYLAVAAVREAAEETGYRVRICHHLSPTRYQVADRPKIVHWWLAEPTGEKPGELDGEADAVEWWPVQRAIAQLSYRDDAATILQALRSQPRPPILMVRHAKAMNRKQWQGLDADRRLTERGRRQAMALVPLFEAFGVGELASSTSTRCMRTLAPYAEHAGLEVRAIHAISEEAAEADPSGVLDAMAQLWSVAQESTRPLVICGHRPVLPAMFDFLGVTPERVLKPAEVVLVYPGAQEPADKPHHIAPKL
ncbi:MAG: NUDIX domain-containing protein [Acidobacteriota bacterium]|nr:NUDIX domain-containing protein [Acidobacteriota bacterium]